MLGKPSLTSPTSTLHHWDFSVNLKNGNQHTGVLVLVDSHPIQHVQHMEWHLNGVMLEVHNLSHISFFANCYRFYFILFFLLIEDDRVIDF